MDNFQSLLSMFILSLSSIAENELCVNSYLLESVSAAL